jgi:DNA-binding NarL/FixJ family response regulator
MPGLSGRDLADRLTAARPDLRVLFVSGYSGEALAHHGILDPDLAYLEKPFSPDALAIKVREVLDRPPPVPPAASG